MFTQSKEHVVFVLTAQMLLGLTDPCLRAQTSRLAYDNHAS